LKAKNCANILKEDVHFVDGDVKAVKRDQDTPRWEPKTCSILHVCPKLTRVINKSQVFNTTSCTGIIITWLATLVDMCEVNKP